MGIITRDTLIESVRAILDEKLPVCVGVDVGQIRDPSALCVSEVSQLDTGKLRFGPSPQPARLDSKYGIWNNDGTFQPGSKGEMARLRLKPITFSHGEKYNRSTGVLAKAFLVSRLQSLLQGGHVHGPDIPEMKATVEELKVFEVKVSENGKDTYGAVVGKHDDLAVALGLSTLEDPFADRVSYSRRVY